MYRVGDIVSLKFRNSREGIVPVVEETRGRVFMVEADHLTDPLVYVMFEAGREPTLRNGIGCINWGAYPASYLAPYRDQAQAA